MKKKREDWTRLYHKTLKGLETMINMQRMVNDIERIAEEVNTTITEIEGLVLTVSINNRTTNTTNITQSIGRPPIPSSKQYGQMSFQIQRMLADKLDHYKKEATNM